MEEPNYRQFCSPLSVAMTMPRDSVMVAGKPPRKALEAFLEVRAEASVEAARDRLSKALMWPWEGGREGRRERGKELGRKGRREF